MAIHEALAALGLGEKAAKVYLCILQRGDPSVPEIALWTGIKRTTVYNLIEELTARRLISQTPKGKRMTFHAEAPERLLDGPRKALDQLSLAMPQLRALFNAAPHKPRLQYYEGLEGIRQVQDQMLKTRNKEYFYFGSARHILQTLGQDYLRDYVRRRVALGIWSNALRLQDQETDEPCLAPGDANLRRVRYLPGASSAYMVSSMTIYDEKVSIQSALGESWALVIESQEMAALLTTLWQTLWNVAAE